MKSILGIDIGFGSVKVVFGQSDGTITNMFKFTSVISLTEPDGYINDPRIYEYKGKHYYVGDDALQMPSEAMIDITEYKNLEYYAPLFLYYVLHQLDKSPDIIVCGLSKAQLHNSGYFKEALQSFTVNNTAYNFTNIWILPQGAGSKLAIDEYGDNFPKKQTQFHGQTNYVGVDIGFNTLDLFLVTNGKTSPNLFVGIEGEGVMKIASKIQDLIKSEHSKDISLHEAKEVLDSGLYKLRGQKFDMHDKVQDIKKAYLQEMLDLVNERFAGSLDKCDFVFLTGGGSAFFKGSQDGYVKVPQGAYEYYNGIGFFIFGSEHQ